ncbi:MAG: 7-carboxy-7-deazaguanine synthase QueE [Campylobacter sp.]|nr:7-carboxy-7-deazaguanine synthase QueE [Campylobacter sp.]
MQTGENSKSLELVESFLSIQGEGAYQGRLALFLRFFGCNLNCIGFDVKTPSKKTGEILIGCDSARAVFKGHFEHKRYSNGEILSLVDSYCRGLKSKPIIVITGGEPLIHHKNENFINLVQNLLERNFDVHFETNATIEIDSVKFPIYKKCKFALGIKLAYSGIDKVKRINPKAIKAICENSKESFYKFVLSSPGKNDLEQILQVLKIYDAPVWCMAMGANRAQLEQNSLDVANFAIKYGFNYSERIHVRLWDRKEGV